jgi:hypothetical protein
MNASDIIKARQNRTLYQAYYRPTIFPSRTTSTITYYPISTISTSSGYISSFTSSVNTQYQYICQKPDISYEISNSINNGKYLCEYPYCSTLSIWNTGEIIPVGVCDCKISVLNWKNPNPTIIYNVSTATYSSIIVQSTIVQTGQTPVICPLASFYQGNEFDYREGCKPTYYI